ncbi:flagellar hook-basal body complex protein FliE [Leeia oryzae]|uniref:flagellar hook-basal body complex protein FliE n=1 Tax=Leeia oryzae TaxID=356662 RepID=UPI0004763266|nr:flagellar hook-basal body complex protein FliE [Leeia oryzae]
MNVNGVQQLLSEMKSMSDAAQGVSSVAGVSDTPQQGFASLLQNALNQVNTTQQQSEASQQAFATGEPNVDLQDVMVSMQKASLSFQSMVQVRNKLVTAYQEVMNMQV